MQAPKAVISVDYGTTAVGYRFVNFHEPEIPQNTQTVSNWPGHCNSTERSGKVPSKFAYGAENNVDRDSWGFEVSEDMTSCSWTKLVLEADANGLELGQGDLGDDVFHVPGGKQADSVVRDYLRRLHDHIWSQEPFKSIGNLEVEYIFTVPASFSRGAQLAMVAAAKDAGFSEGNINLLTESEAVAGYVFERGLLKDIKAGEKVMIVDLGGGTSDVSSYVALRAQNGLQLQQLSAPQSRNIGGINIDRNFSSLLTDRFDPEFGTLPSNRTGPSSRLMREFARHKRDITDGDRNGEQFRIRLPMGIVDPNPLHYDVDYSEIIISMDDWRAVFNPVLKEILEFIRDMYNAAGGVQYMVFAGGVVNLPWVQEYFRKLLVAEHISVIFSPNPEMAVARGGVWYATQNTPLLVECPRHYGVAKPGDNTINWVLHKGQRYATGHTTQVQLRHVYKATDPKSVLIAVCGYNGPCSPISTSDDVENLGMFLLDLSKLNLAQFWHREDDHGRIEYSIKFTLEIECDVSRGVLYIRALRPDGCLIGEEMELPAKLTSY
ncbi:Hsp70 family protein [Aspergillus tubingensis]|uniref:Hsp70 family protein n=1 Tax=Aspergillus tubingensis TaxID=5068 RepID=UPI001578367F|nr:actin-like ATPase domain-containing protein [Aspergillus tubingensis]GFN13604.1 actin-like ATPase domain-containing protein [Aspergillus tubingensis]